jgi:HAD superfamily hydrolase (TIGR01509 family)
VLFDMDGLLIDSEPQWLAAEARTAWALGASWGSQQHVDLLGSNLEYAARYLINHAKSQRSVAEVMQLLLAHMTDELTREVTFRPGANKLLNELSGADIPMALVTNSVLVHVTVVLNHLPERPFRHVVAADDVTRFKPHPEPYLRALELLGVRPDAAVVLEDSPAGVSAGEAAGCHVVAVPSTLPIEIGPRRSVVESLDAVSLSYLRSVIRS